MKTTVRTIISLGVMGFALNTPLAEASTITLYFTGSMSNVVTNNTSGVFANIVDGDSFRGTVSFDPTSMNTEYGSPSGLPEPFSGVGGVWDLSGPQSAVSFLITDLRTGVTLKNSPYTSGGSSADIRKNYSGNPSPGSYNAYSLVTHARSDLNPNGTPGFNYLGIDLRISDLNGNRSTLFPNPAAGLAFDQPLNIANETIAFSFVEQKGDTWDYKNMANLNLTYFGTTDPTIGYIPEPETYTLMLAALGLLGLARHRKQT